MTPRELAEAAVQQQQRLREDAGQRLDAAASARVDAETAVAAAEEVHARALAASAAKRSDDKLADTLGRASVRLGHARDDHRAAVAAHEQATSAVAAAEERVAAAKHDLELSQTLEALNDPAVSDELRAHGEAIGAALTDVRNRVLLVRGHLARSATLAARARELGQTDARPHDGLAASAGLAAKLVEAGAALPNGDAGHTLRWPLMSPAHRDVDPHATGAVRDLAVVATGVLEQGTRFTERGIDHGKASLARLASVWGGHAHYASAREALAEADRQAVAVRDEGHRAAHEQRLKERRTNVGVDEVTFDPHWTRGLPPNPMLDPPEGQEDDLKV